MIPIPIARELLRATCLSPFPTKRTEKAIRWLRKYLDGYKEAMKQLPLPCGCDWGHCMGDAVDVRWSQEHGWLPVCEKHKEGPHA